MRREPDDSVVWRKSVSRVAPNGLNSLRHSRFKKHSLLNVQIHTQHIPLLQGKNPVERCHRKEASPTRTMIFSDECAMRTLWSSSRLCALSETTRRKYRWSGFGLPFFRMLLVVVSLKCRRPTVILVTWSGIRSILRMGRNGGIRRRS